MKVFYFQNKYYPKAKQGLFFDQCFNFQHEQGVAFESENAFFASGINHGGSIHFIKIPNSSISNIRDWVEKSFGDTNSVESKYIPGTFYKRIWRPLVCNGNFYKAISQEKINQSFVSLKILLNKLEELFETVEPTESNLLTYGHKIREILLLACMEVESSWTAVLRENKYSSNGAFTTNNFVKLKEPMFLDGYQMDLVAYPSFCGLMPFIDWDVNKPTKSLSWYDAYNKTKHDRENNLQFATLINAVTAVSAVVVMFYAQFGFRFEAIWDNHKSHYIRGSFGCKTVGLKKYEKNYYIPKVVLENNLPKPLWDWTALDYPF
ncbi:hypothetical protein KAI92_00285 [Candidatus Parcubacteria bacterium]|nr:hypothetical protein [Candidatus Parcubacteria bacterium]